MNHEGTEQKQQLLLPEAAADAGDGIGTILFIWNFVGSGLGEFEVSKYKVAHAT